MRIINSLHCWNTGYEDDWPDALRCCDPKSGIVILSGMLEHWYPEFRARMGPEFLVACRMYPEGDWLDGIGRHWNELDPSVWAQECYRRLAAVPGVLDDPYVCVSPNNEPDLRVEGLDVDDDTYLTIEQYRFIWNWQAAWMCAMRGLLGSSPVRLGTGPLAGGKDIPGYPPDYEYYLPEFRALAGMADCIWTHGYAQSSSGDQPDNGGYWYALRALRPASYREQVQGLPPVNGIPDPGGVCTQYPEHTYILAETGTGRHSDLSATYATFLQFQNIYWHHAESRRFALCAPFIWNSGPEHGHNRIQPNHDLWRSLQTMTRYDAVDWPPVITQENTMDQVELWLTDMWRRQGVEPDKNDAFWKYSLSQARLNRIIIPQHSADGNYVNWSHDRYILGYMIPVPLWCEKNVWEVHEGFPFS